MMNLKELYKRKQNLIRNTFISSMRKFNNFENIPREDILKADEYAKQIIKYYDNMYINNILSEFMKYVNNNLYNYENKDFLILILIKTFDPELKLYKIYELECNIKRIKMQSLITLGFYEPELIKYEKQYIIKFCNMDDFDFTKKLEI